MYTFYYEKIKLENKNSIEYRIIHIIPAECFIVQMHSLQAEPKYPVYFFEPASYSYCILQKILFYYLGHFVQKIKRLSSKSSEKFS